jgi:uncharacterized protein (UPF0303 family)
MQTDRGAINRKIASLQSQQRALQKIADAKELLAQDEIKRSSDVTQMYAAAGKGHPAPQKSMWMPATVHISETPHQDAHNEACREMAAISANINSLIDARETLERNGLI